MDTVDVNNNCRACLSMDPLQLFDWNVDVFESVTYMECFRQCTQLEELVDEPTMLCYICASDLKSAYDFIQKCRESDGTLRLKQDLTYTREESPLDKVDLQWVTKIEAENLSSPARMSGESNDVEVEIADSSSLALDEVETADSSCLAPDEFEKSNVKSKRRQAEGLSAKSTIKTLRGRSRKKSNESETSPTMNHKRKKVGVPFSKQSKRDIALEHKQQSHLCHICSRVFKDSSALRKHSLTHEDTRERNFTCDYCDLKFLTKSHSRSHEQTHESNRQRQFQCDQCDKAFFYMNGLNEHKKLHSDNILECQICEKRYFRSIDLEIHLRSHSGETPYQCKYCDKAFKQVDKLNVHARKHEGYRYSCDICEKDYSDPSTLRQHRMEHTGQPLKCGVCGKGFAKKSKIRVHIGGVHKVKNIAEMDKLIIALKK